MNLLLHDTNTTIFHSLGFHYELIIIVVLVDAISINHFVTHEICTPRYLALSVVKGSYKCLIHLDIME
jgi:hypothetical protein